MSHRISRKTQLAIARNRLIVIVVNKPMCAKSGEVLYACHNEVDVATKIS
jgi:hypothetical protein